MKVSGIYKIQRIGTDQCYVGSSHWIGKRWATHRRELNNARHQASRLQNSWNKYGQDAFEFVVLEEVSGDGDELKSLLVQREQAWMDQLSPCFNTVPAAGSTLGFKMPREIVERHKQQITGRKATPEETERLRTLALGRKRSDATKEKQRQNGIRRGMPALAIENSVKARRGKKQTAEHIAKVVLSRSGYTHSQEALAAMRASNTPEVRAKKGDAARGKKQSQEQIAKKSASLRAYHERRRNAGLA